MIKYLKIFFLSYMKNLKYRYPENKELLIKINNQTFHSQPKTISFQVVENNQFEVRLGNTETIFTATLSNEEFLFFKNLNNFNQKEHLFHLWNQTEEKCYIEEANLITVEGNSLIFSHTLEKIQFDCGGDFEVKSFSEENLIQIIVEPDFCLYNEEGIAIVDIDKLIHLFTQQPL